MNIFMVVDCSRSVGVRCGSSAKRVSQAPPLPKALLLTTLSY
jgi:hypothetical protein